MPRSTSVGRHIAPLKLDSVIIRVDQGKHDYTGIHGSGDGAQSESAVWHILYAVRSLDGRSRVFSCGEVLRVGGLVRVTGQAAQDVNPWMYVITAST